MSDNGYLPAIRQVPDIRQVRDIRQVCAIRQVPFIRLVTSSRLFPKTLVTSIFADGGDGGRGGGWSGATFFPLQSFVTEKYVYKKNVKEVFNKKIKK